MKNTWHSMVTFGQIKHVLGIYCPVSHTYTFGRFLMSDFSLPAKVLDPLKRGDGHFELTVTLTR